MQNKPTFGGGGSGGPSQAQIAERARELWMHRGSPGGRDLECWLDAERELRGQIPDRSAADGGRDPASKRDWVEAEKRLDGLVEQPPGPACRTPDGEKL